ncbi:hypothetical protein EMIT013CA1_10203 [Bacillus sp. IT-13CA1]
MEFNACTHHKSYSLRVAFLFIGRYPLRPNFYLSTVSLIKFYFLNSAY